MPALKVEPKSRSRRFNYVMAVSASTQTHIRRRLLFALHAVTLIVAAALIVYISIDTLTNITPRITEGYMRIGFWTCIFFQGEIVIEALIGPHTRRKFIRLGIFFIICCPLLSILHHYNVQMSAEVEYLLRFVPLVRAAAVLASMWGQMTTSWVNGMFRGYITLLVSTLYILSLLFFVEEYHINPQIQSFWDTLWYAVMQMTTCGSNINPVTPAGKAIGIILSAEGLILFPVFTVYITHAFARTRASQNV